MYLQPQVATSSNASGNNDGSDNMNSNGVRGGKGDENGRDEFPMRGQGRSAALSFRVLLSSPMPVGWYKSGGQFEAHGNFYRIPN